MIVNHNINNMSGGVSRQPDEARFDNQVEEMINFVPTISNGLKRRNPLEFVNSDDITYTNDMPIHSYNRGDGLEKYGMIIVDNELRVYDAEGNRKTVTYSGDNPLSLWNTNGYPITNSADCKFLTVGDTTWLLNRNLYVGIEDDLTPVSSVHKAFYWVSRSFDDGVGGGYTYQIVLNDITYTVEETSTIAVANEFASTIDDVSGFSAVANGSIVMITSDSEFTFEYGDSWGDQASFGWTNSVSKIGDLPSSLDGFTEEEVGTIEITGTDKDTFTSYYLKWNGEYYAETLAEGIKYKLDKETLPAKLVRQSDGTFVLGFLNIDESVDGFNNEWKERKKGDDDSNPIPSFVDNKISNMFFFKNRLGFTSEENVILSETGSYYNFFATTVIELVDSDPIDASVDSDTVSIIRNVNATAGSLTLWSDNAQFVLSGGDILSPATTRIGKTSSYYCDNNLVPITLDNEIMFFRKMGDTFQALSYNPASLNTDSTSSNALNSHIEGYIPSTIDRVVASSGNNMVLFTDSEDRHTIYVYKYFIENKSKLMSSWFKWEFTSYINSIEVLDGVLFVLCDGNKICKVDLSIREIDNKFIDYNTVSEEYDINYESIVTMSKFNIETKQGTRIIREPFYVKNIKLTKSGDMDINIVNEERNSYKTVKNKFLGRRIFIGGNSEKVYFEFKSSYNTGCSVNAVSIEGILKTRSRNI